MLSEKKKLFNVVNYVPNFSNPNMSSSAVFRNLLANFAQFSFRFFIGIWFTRFLILSLGTELYGLVPLAWTVTQYLGLITLVMSAPAGRYLIIEISRGDFSAANRIFNTVFWGTSGLSLFIILVGAGISWSVPFIFNVPVSHEADARIIFFAATAAFVFATFSNSFSLSAYVTNRLDLRSLKEALEQIVRVCVAVFFISFLNWQLGSVSLGIFCGAVTGSAIAVLLWKRLTPQLSIKRRNISIPLLKEMTGMGGWMLINQIGTLLFLHTELFIVNLIYGAKSTGMYGALLIFPITLRTVAQLISSTLTPPIMDRYAKKDVDGVINIVCRATRFLSIVVALPIGLICGFSAPILKIWLGPEFVDLAPTLIFLSAHLSINVSVLPMFPLQIMVKKVKVPGLVTCVMGIINVLLAVLLGQPELGLGLIGIALAGAIVLTLKNAIFTPLYGAHILNINRLILFRPMFLGIIGFLLIMASSVVILKIVEISNIFQLFTVLICTSLGYSAIVWSCFLKREDKDWLMNLILQLAQGK